MSTSSEPLAVGTLLAALGVIGEARSFGARNCSATVLFPFNESHEARNCVLEG